MPFMIFHIGTQRTNTTNNGFMVGDIMRHCLATIISGCLCVSPWFAVSIHTKLL